MASLTTALKEWAIAVDALAAGETILLMRKGGIRETGRQFAVPHPTILLFPTYEHQKPELLKPVYAQRLKLTPSGAHPHRVTIKAWADITHVFQISEVDKVEMLVPHHIWNERFVTERFKWKPKQPLHILLLRTYQLPDIVRLANHPEYGGCRSWIDLKESIAINGATPVLDDADYAAQVEGIQQILVK
ncbi:MAG: DUF1802 family protein [Leptolyngbyaceae cyanobacterium MO_188.B28]|nr:DUF1802 family protein [Leptolyngbyaceae cyanobacterium MO_188.B28]